MKRLIYIFLILIPVTGLTQNRIEWTGDHTLSKQDFRAPLPNSEPAQGVLGSFYVEYEMNAVQMASRNLNKNVTCYFEPEESYIADGDMAATNRMLRYQNLVFDVYELQARKLRQKFFTERTRLLTKGPGTLRAEVAEEHDKLISRIETETQYGYVTEKITKWEKWTEAELEKLADFCKTCNPKKKKRGNKSE